MYISFLIHRNILTATSEYFAASLGPDFEEGKHNQYSWVWMAEHSRRSLTFASGDSTQGCEDLLEIPIPDRLDCNTLVYEKKNICYGWLCAHNLFKDCKYKLEMRFYGRN